MRLLLSLAAAAPLVLACTPASAAIPEPVRAMIDAAIESGDGKAVATAIDLAKKTNPGEADAIEALHAGFREKQARLADARKADELRAIRTAGVLERWSGKGELGGFRSTGNTDTFGLTGAVALDRKGIDWRHKLTVRADYQRSRGRTTREKFFAAYEPRYEMREDLFAYGLAQFDRDRFQGYDARYALSGGIGATVVDTAALDLSVKAGPALRITETTDGMSDTRLAGLLGVDPQSPSGAS